MTKIRDTKILWRIISRNGNNINASTKRIPIEEVIANAPGSNRDGSAYMAMPTMVNHTTVGILLPNGSFDHSEPMATARAKSWVRTLNKIARESGTLHLAFEVNA